MIPGQLCEMRRQGLDGGQNPRAHVLNQLLSTYRFSNVMSTITARKTRQLVSVTR